MGWAFETLSSRVKLACLARITDAYRIVARAHASLAIARSAYSIVQELIARCSNDYDDARDAGMAQNVRWVADSLYPDANIAIWAHNGHVAAWPFSEGSVLSMGTFLRDHYEASP